MSRFTNLELDSVQQALEAQKSALFEQIKSSNAEREDSQYLAVLGQGAGDSSDEALASSLADFSVAHIDHKVMQYRALEAAESRIQLDDFAVCCDCGEDIPLARMVASPAAERCVECQAAYERTHAGHNHGTL